MPRIFRRFRKKASKAMGARKRTYKKKSVSGKVSALSRAVRIMSRQEEIKTLQYSISDRSVGPYYNMGSSFQIHQLTANGTTLPIPINATSGGRIGNKISFVSGKIRMNFYAAPYDATTNPYPQPCYVLVYVLTRRDTAQGIPTASLPYFYQSGSTAVGPSGYLADKFNVVNNDLYRIYKKYVLKVGPASNTGTGASPGNAYWSNNDYSLNKSLTIDFTKDMIKTVKFNDSASNEPTSRGLWLAIEAISATNTGMALNQLPVNYLAEIDLRWKDT